MEASLQKFAKGIRKAIAPDPNTLYGKRTTIKQGIDNFKAGLAAPGPDESVLRAKLRANRTKKR